MSQNEIEKMQAKSNVKFDVARKIRELLDAAMKEYGAAEWEDDSMETEISELVFGD